MENRQKGKEKEIKKLTTGETDKERKEKDKEEKTYIKGKSKEKRQREREIGRDKRYGKVGKETQEK